MHLFSDLESTKNAKKGRAIYVLVVARQVLLSSIAQVALLRRSRLLSKTLAHSTVTIGSSSVA